MKVKELIEVLKTKDQEAEIRISTVDVYTEHFDIVSATIAWRRINSEITAVEPFQVLLFSTEI